MSDKNRKPNILWMEGLLTLFEAEFPHESDDPLRLGFGLGQQIIGLYIVELLLKYALDDAGSSHGKGHNLPDMYRKLPRHRRRAVQRRYTQLLNSEVDWTWDIAETVESLLSYLGENPITDTRYFWETGRTHLTDFASILIASRLLRQLIYALFIELHQYPTRGTVKRFDTAFVSLVESLEKDNEGSQDSPR